MIMSNGGWLGSAPLLMIMERAVGGWAAER